MIAALQIILIAGVIIAATCILLVRNLPSRMERWDLATKVTSKAEARRLADILVADGHDPFRTDCVRDVVFKAVLKLHRANPGAWGLGDLINEIRNVSVEGNIEAVIYAQVEKAIRDFPTRADEAERVFA